MAVVAAEATPFTAAGSVGELASGLSSELGRRGHRVLLIIPAYGSIDRTRHKLMDSGRRLEVALGDRLEEARFESAREGEIEVVLVRHDYFFDRPGPYADRAGHYVDNAERFSYFTQAALAYLQDAGVRPHVIHANDWPTALCPVYRDVLGARGHELQSAAVVLSVQHLSAQGQFEKSRFRDLNLPRRFLSPAHLGQFDRISFLRGGLRHADAVVLPSRRFAEQAQGEAEGRGLDDALRSRREHLFGVLNGLARGVADPSRDRFLKANYRADDLIGKRSCKLDLQNELGLPLNAEEVVVGVLARPAGEWGADLLVQALPQWPGLRAQLAVVGRGERHFEEALRQAARALPGSFGVRLGQDDLLVRKLLAGADVLLLPARSQPDGRDALCALGYGTIPVVRAVGALDDVVVEFDAASGAGNGFRFVPYKAAAMLACLKRAVELKRGSPERWQTLVANALGFDHSWSRAAEEYERVYHHALQWRSSPGAPNQRRKTVPASRNTKRTARGSRRA